MVIVGSNLVAAYHHWVCIFGEFVVGLSHLMVSMCVGAVLVELALALLDPEFAELSLVVVILDVHHLENQLSWKGLIK
jgi:hypothetical protein